MIDYGKFRASLECLNEQHENHLLPSPVEKWLSYADNRNATSHDFDGEKAKTQVDVMADLIEDAISLYQTLTGKTWE